MPNIRKVWANCPVCSKRVEVEIDEDTIKHAPSSPVSVVNVHGSPSHLMVLYVDSEFQIRGVEGHKTLVQETDEDLVTLAIERQKAKGKYIEVANLAEGLGMIRGIEFVDTKGSAIVTLHEAGPTIEGILSPSGRIKARFVVEDQVAKDKLEPLLKDVFTVLEKFEPLRPPEVRLLLEVLVASVSSGEPFVDGLIQSVAEMAVIMPKIVVNPTMYEAMIRYTMPDDFAKQELELVDELLNGDHTLKEIVEIVEERGLSPYHLLQALEKLRAGEAIIFRKREIPGFFRFGR